LTSAWTRSPQSLDPLSWFTGPLVPLVFGGLAVALGVTASLSMGPTARHWLQWPALACVLAACILISVLTRPRGPEFAGWRAAVPVVLGGLSVLLSGIGYSGGGLRLELWWASIGLAFVLASLAPYSSTIRMITVGAVSCLVTVAVVILTGLSGAGHWPPVSTVLLGVGPVLIAAVAGSVFSYQVAWRIADWASMRSDTRLSSSVLGETAKLRILRSELADVSDRALPLLQGVVEAGIVTDEIRAQAAALSEELRAELVERSNRSWLDRLAPGLKLTVVDSEHRADRMTPPQRSALLGLLRAASDGGGQEQSPLLIELRGEPDGSTAVALSLDVQLPEGRRITLLSPHYLTLKTAVDELQWEGGRQLRMHFRLPPEL
jgi:hypothetical protein